MSDLTDAAPQAIERPETAARGILGRLWRGEVPLGQAFWSYTIIGGTALNVAATLLAMAALAMDAPGALAALIFALPIPYNVLMLIAVWRSAGAYQGPRLWADLARVTAVVWTILMIAA